MPRARGAKTAQGRAGATYGLLIGVILLKPFPGQFRQHIDNSLDVVACTQLRCYLSL